MTEEEKKLVLKDLCARLPYGVKGKTLGSKTCILSFIGNDGSVTADTYHCWLSSKQFVPYLRPMSSMTKEEEVDYDATFDTIYINGHYDSCMSYKSFDFLNKNMFDYRGLIEKDLTLEAPEGMYN